MFHAVIQKGALCFELVQMQENGAEVATLGRIVSARGGAEYRAYDKEEKRGASGQGSHRRCLEALCAFWEVDPKSVKGHTFTRKADKRRGLVAL